MLRAVVLVLSVALIAAGLWPWLSGGHVIWAPLIWGVVLLIATLFERWRYRGDAGLDGEGWVATEERFVDPESGKLVQVYYQAASGERRYLPLDR